MKILRNSTYKEMETKIKSFSEMLDDFSFRVHKLNIENSKLEKEIRDYRVKDFIVEVKKNRKNIPNGKFISEYLVGRNQQELINHLVGTRTPEEFWNIFGEYTVFTEVPMDDRFEILLKDMSERKEFLEEQGFMEEENEEENE